MDELFLCSASSSDFANIVLHQKDLFRIILRTLPETDHSSHSHPVAQINGTEETPPTSTDPADSGQTYPDYRYLKNTLPDPDSETCLPAAVRSSWK